MRKASRWLAAAGLLGLAIQASAGDIYVCKGANGVNSYQNTPCPTPTAELRHNTYDNALARPGTPTAQEAQPRPVQQREVYQSQPASASYAGSQPAPSTPTGYQCTAGQRKWMQSTPCPATYMASQSVDVDGHLITGEMVTGTGWMQVEKPVQQNAMDHDTYCDQVRAGARIGQDGGSSTSQSYERNKIKRNECGG